MTISFVGNFISEHSSESQYARLLENMGHTVIRLQEGQANTEEIYAKSINAQIVVWIHTHSWRTYGNINLHQLFGKFRLLKIPTVTYHLDLWMGLSRQKDLYSEPFYKLIDYFFTVDKLMADWFNENTKVKGVFLPAGIFDNEIKMLPPRDATYDIVFVGAKSYHKEWPYRPQLINFLGERYGTKFLHVGKDGPLGAVRGLELNQIYSNAKIAVGDTLNIGFNYPYYSSDRLWESIGRGGFTIYPNIKGLDQYFTDGKEIVFYEHGNLTDLAEKIDYYRTHDDEREAIRKAGFERCKKEGGYTNRWKFILEYVEK